MKRLKKTSELGIGDKLIAAGKNPRDKAFSATLISTGMPVTEAIQIKVIDIDFKRGTLTILHLKERVKLKCPDCGELLGKRHIHCPGCGKKVEQATLEKVEQQRKRIIPINRDTLRQLVLLR